MRASQLADEDPLVAEVLLANDSWLPPKYFAIWTQLAHGSTSVGASNKSALAAVMASAPNLTSCAAFPLVVRAGLGEKNRHRLGPR